jgi:hypothetical protein
MRSLPLLSTLAGGLLLSPAGGGRVTAEELPPEYKAAITKGLEWVAKQQHRDGHWEATGGQYPSAMTGLGGMVLLMEGSTLREGKYADNIRRAVDWLMERSQRNGLLANPNNAVEAGRYMYGHGFALLFLSQIYGEEEDNDRRRKLEDILTRAVLFTGKAQSSRGGWYYTSAADGHDADEGSVTVTQMQALRAAKNAGIAVPKSIIDKGMKYLEHSTTDGGGVIYSLLQAGGSRRHRLRLQRRRVQLALGQEVDQVLSGPYPGRRQQPLRPRRIYTLLLCAGPVHPGRGGLRQALP